MFNIIIEGRIVATILAWDRNDAWVYASRRFGAGTVFTVERAA